MPWWAALGRQGRTSPISTLEPWKDWLPPDLFGFASWFFDSLEALNQLVLQVGERQCDAVLEEVV